MRKPYATSLDEDLIKQVKILAVESEVSANELIESALKMYLAIVHDQSKEQIKNIIEGGQI